VLLLAGECPEFIWDESTYGQPITPEIAAALKRTASGRGDGESE
jgi:hypothetical protein